MFQTEIIHFLQSFSNDVLTFIFRLFSDIGHTTAIMPVVVAITVGLHFRIGVVMMHTALWTGVTTTYLKEVFALPRPVNVDSSLQMLTTGSPNPSPFNSMGAGGFFEALPGHVVEYLRSHRIDSFGLPSGHTSTAVAVWGSIYLYFARWTELIPALAGKKNRGGKEKKQWGHMVAIVFLIAIPFSRMYLGRHFLGDVLGGYLLGFAI
ncbi:MAG: phosphatase PAP2 family protein, partial [bacterium]|nr:phosphatase PAP2 family protein [bacterium]